MRALETYCVLRSEHTGGSVVAESTFTFRVDSALKAAFSEVAAAQEHTAAQLLRLLMREEVSRWRDSKAHDAWFRTEVTRGLEEADDPATTRRTHDAVASSWQRQRAELERQAAARTA